MIRLTDLTLRRGARVLLEHCDLLIHPGEKIGLVGRNGAGKSSLFCVLDGSLAEDAGRVELPPEWRFAQVAQNMPETDEAATQFVLDGDTRLVQIHARLADAEARQDGMAQAQAHADLLDAGAHDARARAQALILGLGFAPAQLDWPVNRFSGGWRMRLQLARALMCPSDLLLLDEPTNHLDLDALVWLEGWLKRYPGTLLVISHDREFLDAVTGTTVHIEHATLRRYSGNYSQFELLHAQRLAQQHAAWQRQQDQVAHLEQFIERFRAKATKARQAQSRIKQIERMQKIAPVLASADFQFRFHPPPTLPNPMLALRDASLGYGAAHNPPVLRGVTRTVRPGQRIGILGANGQGKSTLIKTIARELRPLGGQVTEGKGLRIGYFAQQEMDVLRPDETPLQHMVRCAARAAADGPAAREQELRNHLGSFDFGGDKATQSVGSMSGGEKARLVLALLVWQRPNLLLLDEPTNHLDLVTRQALALALNDFDGTLMLVSHDRALLRAVCEEFWLVRAGSVTSFDGDLDDYQRLLQEAARQATQRPADAPEKTATHPPATGAGGARTAAQRRSSAQQRQRLGEQIRPLQKECDDIEQRLDALHAERDALQAQFSQPAADGAALAQAGRRLKTCQEEEERLEARWLELGEQIEGLRQQHASA